MDIRRLAKDDYWKYGYKVADSSTTIFKDAIFNLPELASPPTSWFTHLKVSQTFTLRDRSLISMRWSLPFVAENNSYTDTRISMRQI